MGFFVKVQFSLLLEKHTTTMLNHMIFGMKSTQLFKGAFAFIACGVGLFICESCHAADDFDGNVVAIQDASTIIVQIGSHEVTVRLYGVDGSTLDSNSADLAQQFLRKNLIGRSTHVVVKSLAGEEEVVGVVSVIGSAATKTLVFNIEILRLGLARCVLPPFYVPTVVLVSAVFCPFFATQAAANSWGVW